MSETHFEVNIAIPRKPSSLLHSRYVLRGCHGLFMTKRSYVFQHLRTTLKASVSELVDDQTRLFTWPASLVLSAYLVAHRDEVENKKVLELGAGTGLVSVVSGLMGAKGVLATDRDQESTLANLEASIASNGEGLKAACSVAGLDWSQSYRLLPVTDEEPFDLILGSDILYSNEDFDDILLTVSKLLELAGPTKGRFITAYQERTIHRSLAAHLEQYRLKAKRLPSPLHRVHEAGSAVMITKEGEEREVEMASFDSIHLLEITRVIN